MRLAEDLYAIARDAFLSVCRTVTNFNVGSRVRSLLEASAAAQEELSYEADQEYLGLFSQSAAGDVLDLRATEMGLARKTALAASGVVRFTGLPLTVVPAGTVVSTDPAIEPVAEYTTDAVATLGATYPATADVAVTARETGQGGNRQAGEVVELLSSVVGIESVVNPAEISGGREAETDPELRARLALRWYSLGYGGTPAAFESTALEVDGVAEAVCLDNWNGPGTVKILVWSLDGTGALVPASAALVAAVQAYYGDTRRPLCCSVTVESPAAAVVPVAIYAQLAAGADWDVVAPLIRNAVIGCFAGLGAGDQVTKVALEGAVVGVSGVADVVVARPVANVYVDPADTATLGRLEVFETSLEAE